MPQKKNPDLLELVRGKSGRIIGNATSLIVTMKGLPLAYNKDLQEAQEPLFAATDAMLGLLPLVTGWMKEMALEFGRMENAAQTGFMNAWAAATYLTQLGIPSRLAHEKVGKAVQLCVEKKCELQDISLDVLRAIEPAFAQDFYSCLKLESVLSIHDVAGGTAPNRVRQAMAAAKKKIEALREEVHAHA
jgi:argininosuccinate lyase